MLDTTPHHKLIDETGNTYGDVTVIRRAGSKNSKAMWECLCECGNIFVTRGSSLRAGSTRSCGCKAMLITGYSGFVKHGGFGTPEYKTWCTMIGRCHCETNTAYHYYGGRGIVVCDRWRHSFENFLNDMGKRPEGLSLDRIDNDGPYSPDNCRWATRTQQMNNRRSNVILTRDGQSMTLTEWARLLGYNVDAIRKRIKAGWSDERILATPIRAKRSQRSNG